ncbi:division/cell wall cluster transcriptional repressor MraZ [Gemmobacter nectariphilus]|uniref:division/cell wall cluster transcriptional repressor MraZ n=1 Tax=Gemmobacter nectariphilus TaxID=220343 RepID=UPI000405B256|nr:division/cell wall cluster transcriptional repressor MraZ [Gemmobacter nectariphilus]
MHFSGTITQRVDGKGRVSIPADFRAVLAEGDPAYDPDTKRLRMRVVYGDPSRKCLEIYTIKAFDKILSRVAQLPEGSDEREILELFLVSGSEVVEVDADGRTILAQRLRDHMGLPRDGGEAVCAGALDLFRMWTPEEFEAERQRKLAAVKARMAGGGNILKLLPPNPEG